MGSSEHRLEASGYFSLFISLATSIFPVGALWLLVVTHGNVAPVFLLAGALPLVGAALCLLIGYRPEPAATVQAAPAATGLGRLFDREVLPAAVPQMFLAMGNPATSAFVTLFAQRLGIGLEHISWYFLASGLTSVLARGALGRLSDRFGRGAACAIGFVSTFTGFLLLAAAPGLPVIILAGVFCALGSSCAGAASLAFAIDLANPERRGTAMATYSLSNQVGAGIGAPIWGTLIVLVGYRGMYVAAAGSALLGLASIMITWRMATGQRTWYKGAA